MKLREESTQGGQGKKFRFLFLSQQLQCFQGILTEKGFSFHLD